MSELSPSSPIRSLPGIGPTREAAFAQMGIFTLSDLLYRIPRAYENRGFVRLLKDGLDGSLSSYLLIIGSVPKNVRIRKDMTLTKFRAFDDSGSVEIVFFNQPYLKDTFSVGEAFRFYGKLSLLRNGIQMASPKFEEIKADRPLADYYSVYSIASGITPKLYAQAIETALRVILPTLSDFLPEDIRLQNKMPTLSTALRGIHRPENAQELQNAIRRLAFDEFFLLGLCSAFQKRRPRLSSAPILPDTELAPLLALLPYELTQGQKNACLEISHDLSGKNGTSMHRILIGDVGCGKTVCAAAAIYIALKNGHQAALMAPTEILARQHYADLSPLFQRLGFHTELLLGSTSQKEKKRIYASLSAVPHETDLVIGTHALLSEKVQFSNLALTVTDEQHRFGVMQRATLKQKEASSHLLVMSATPIPRTLALAMYGDLSVSHIEEMPKGRQRVSTFVVDDSYRERMYGFIRKEVASGGQVYIVCPAIEEKQEAEGEFSPEEILRKESLPPLKNATDLYRSLKEEVFQEIPIGFLHGKMKSAEKEAAMSAFASGETRILVSTTVIEVGVNVPTASLMIVENAERFGLSQLHQLRGRVGRGMRKSYCILVSNARKGPAKDRLDTMHTTYDGYQIAQADLQQRGPGDFFSSAYSEGFRQSGAMDLKFASFTDNALMEAAFTSAKKLLETDPELLKSEHSALRDRTIETLTANAGTIS